MLNQYDGSDDIGHMLLRIRERLKKLLPSRISDNQSTETKCVFWRIIYMLCVKEQFTG